MARRTRELRRTASVGRARKGTRFCSPSLERTKSKPAPPIQPHQSLLSNFASRAPVYCTTVLSSSASECDIEIFGEIGGRDVSGIPVENGGGPFERAGDQARADLLAVDHE